MPPAQPGKRGNIIPMPEKTAKRFLGLPKGFIGVVDSGVGGLSVLRALVARLPQENWVYFADQAHLPYGEKPHPLLQVYAVRIADFLLAQGAKAIVIACNTLSAAALDALRARFPQVPIVGMEPAVKPAVQHTRTGTVAVLATQTTLQSERYRRLKARFGQGVTFLEDPCIGLVEQIEAGRLITPDTLALLERILTPMREAAADTVVLGCTHFPFVAEGIRRVLGDHVHILDPAPAVARHLEMVLRQHGLIRMNGKPGRVLGFTTGNGTRWAEQVRTLVPELNMRVAALPDFWAEASDHSPMEEGIHE